jgi:FkbH-like protein
MLLREEHFAVFQANWNDKAANIQAIAQTLSLGLESMAFVDDNPFEREFVRKVLPDVAVPEMPEDPADYSRTLSAAGYFEAVTFAAEDLQRATFYAQNAQRAALQGQSGDIEGYLASLAMEIEFQPFNETGQARITQLINKSNQFNLTTQRYSESEVARFQHDPNALTLQVRLRDQLGDNGMISVVICRFLDSGVGEIDTWLMSCRVLGRRVEEAVLLELIDHASRHGIFKLRGAYRPTDRNKLVEKHYEKLGFTQVESKSDGTTVWELDTRSVSLKPPPMAVKSSGFETVASEVGR